MGICGLTWYFRRWIPGGKSSSNRYDKNKKQYELPSTNKINVLVVGGFSSTIGERDVILQHHAGNLQRIWSTHPLYMTLQYPLLFLYGEIGYYEGIPCSQIKNKEGIRYTSFEKGQREYVSMREYYR